MTEPGTEKRCPQCLETQRWPEAFMGARGKPINWCTGCQARYRGWEKRTPEEKRALRRRQFEGDGAHRVRLVRKSSNAKLGGIPVTMTERGSCPDTCSFKNSGCYAEEHNWMRYHWERVAEKGLSWRAFCEAVQAFPAGQVWRHNEAGDLPGLNDRIDARALRLLVGANRRAGALGFTFTSKKVLAPLPAQDSTPWPADVAERFWAKVDKNGPIMRPGLSRCWVWTASRLKLRGGYGQFARTKGEPIAAHRCAFFLTHGRWPSVARHQCDNPPCCNPEHISDGSHADNVADKVNRGRVPRGEQHHARHHTDVQLEELKRRRAAGEQGRALAREYGLSEGAVSMICSGRRRRAGSLLEKNRAAIQAANANGFTINLSGHSIEEADRLVALGIGPVTVVAPAGTGPRAFRTPAGNQVTICPAETRGLTCADCQMCALPTRKAIIGFVAHGNSAELVSGIVRGEVSRRRLPVVANA